MRPIPTDLWLMAIHFGKLQQALDDTLDIKILQACFNASKQLGMRLDGMRETARRCPDSKIVIYRHNFR